MFFGSIKNTYASDLIKETHDSIWIFRKGGGKKAYSAKYNEYYIDGKPVYCIEPGLNITTDIYEGELGYTNSPYGDDINKKLELIGYYGYEYPSHQTLEYKMATQALIWELVSGQTVEFWTEPSGAGKFISVRNEKNEIMNLVNNHPSTPSFNYEEKETLVNKEIIFYDNYNVLNNFELDYYNQDELSITIENNALKVTPLRSGNFEIRFKRKTYSINHTTIFVGVDGESQKMGYFSTSVNEDVFIKIKGITGTLTLEKKDADTLNNIKRGDATLINAIFDIYDINNKKVEEIVTDNDGIAISTNLGIGSYYLKERQASIGYNIDTNTYYFEITEDNLYPHIIIYEKIIDKKIKIKKVVGKNEILEPNITFEFYLKSNLSLYNTAITNEFGILEITLPYGIYIVKQKNSIPGVEKIDNFEIIVDDSEEYNKTIVNNVSKAKLKVIKINSNDKSIIKKDGIKFKIKNLDTNTYVCQKNNKICEYKTKNGIFITPEYLEIGNYELEELNENLNDLVWNYKPLKFAIDNNQNYVYDNELILEKEFENKVIKGKINVTKYGEIFKNFENEKINYDNILLNDISFNLYAKNNIYDENNILIYKENDIIGKYKTHNGSFEVNNLYVGNYCLKENNIPNYYLSEKDYCFKISKNDIKDEFIDVNIFIYNHLKKGTFELLKIDTFTNEPLKDVLINIYTLDDNLIFSGTTNELGIIKVDNLPLGKYKYIEVSTPDGYLKNDNVYYFEINDNNEIVSKTLLNEKIKVPNTLSKYNSYLNIIGIGFIILGVNILYDKKEF